MYHDPFYLLFTLGGIYLVIMSFVMIITGRLYLWGSNRERAKLFWRLLFSGKLFQNETNPFEKMDRHRPFFWFVSLSCFGFGVYLILFGVESYISG